MNKKELMKFLETGHNSGEVPCGFWMHFDEDEQCGAKAVKAHARYYRETEVPLIKVMNEHYFQIEKSIVKPKDWSDIPVKEISETNYSEYLTEICQLRESMGNDSFILATIHGVMVSACHATDGLGVFTNQDNMVTRHLKEDPESVTAGLRQIAQSLKKLCLASLEAGADGIYYALLGAEEDRFTQEFFEKYIKPIEIELLQDVKREGIVVLHICKDNPRLPMLKEYPAHVVNWAVHSGAYSLSDGARIFSDKIIMGGFDNRSGTLFTGSKEEIRQEVTAIVKAVGRERLIIGSDCTLPNTIGMEQIKNMVDICKEL